MFFSDVTISKVSHLLIVKGDKVSCQRRVMNRVEVRENLKSSKNSAVTDKGDRERRGGKIVWRAISSVLIVQGKKSKKRSRDIEGPSIQHSAVSPSLCDSNNLHWKKKPNDRGTAFIHCSSNLLFYTTQNVQLAVKRVKTERVIALRLQPHVGVLLACVTMAQSVCNYTCRVFALHLYFSVYFPWLP